MIKHFYCKETKKIFEHYESRKFEVTLQSKILYKLYILDSAVSIQDLRSPPSNMLKKLSGNLKSFYSIRINRQFRLIFQWKNGNAYNVQVIDYH